MVRADAAIIGGTGIGPRLARLGGRRLNLPTPFGLFRCRIADHYGRRIALIERHGAGHKSPPHAVAYGALAWGARSLGVRACLSSAAVGSLRSDWDPGMLAACTGFIELTGRQATMFPNRPAHTAMNSAMSASRRLVEADPELPEAVYVGMNGPRYESPAEIQMLRQLGGDVVGMTAATEAIAFAEAGVSYGCLALITNLGAGLSPLAPRHDEVAEAAEAWGDRAVEILLDAALRA
jgi:5'-methylthioadenosine phosphorylase